MSKFVVGIVAVVCAVSLNAFGQNKVVFDNQSGDAALVKLTGPTMTEVQVANGSQTGVDAAAGKYTIKVRYGTPGNYRYTKGDEFTVTETATARSETTITLHKVVAGNYDSRPISEEDFGKATVSTPRQTENGAAGTTVGASQQHQLSRVDRGAARLRTDGLYSGTHKFGNTVLTTYLRFYEDGTVVEGAYDNKPEPGFFSRDNRRLPTGSLTTVSNVVSFKVTCGNRIEDAEYLYAGVVEGDNIRLSSWQVGGGLRIPMSDKVLYSFTPWGATTNVPNETSPRR